MKTNVKNSVLTGILFFIILTTTGSPPALATTTTAWHPKVTDTWQWQLKLKINPDYPVAVYDIDLFDTPITTIQALQATGKK